MQKQLLSSTLLKFSLVSFLLFPHLCEAAVIASPSVVIFTSPQQSATISLVLNGMPLAASAILDSQLLASGHDYRHMLSLEKMEGAVRIMPSASLEVGSYDLNIETLSGPVSVHVYAPLSDVPDNVDKLSALTAKSEQQIEASLGLSNSLVHEELQLNLPPVYYEGQTLELEMPASAAPGRSSLWFMNGSPAAGGASSRYLSYTFATAGEYVLTFVETEQVNGTTRTVARGHAVTRVVESPIMHSKVSVNTKVSFHAPTGYRDFNWSLNGVATSKLPDYHYTFQAPGLHDVECMASAPTQGPATGYMRTRYRVTVE